MRDADAGNENVVVTGNDGGGGVDGGGAGDGGGEGSANACAPAGANVISDFEDGTGDVIRQGGRDGWWYVVADTAGGNQTPTSNPTGPIAVASVTPPIPASDTANMRLLRDALDRLGPRYRCGRITSASAPRWLRSCRRRLRA